LPTDYYAFQRETIDFPAAFQATEKFLKRALDVRLLTLAAKLSALDRDVAGFARFIGNSPAYSTNIGRERIRAPRRATIRSASRG
jgi:hypothetical protein